MFHWSYMDQFVEIYYQCKSTNESAFKLSWRMVIHMVSQYTFPKLPINFAGILGEFSRILAEFFWNSDQTSGSCSTEFSKFCQNPVEFARNSAEINRKFRDSIYGLEMASNGRSYVLPVDRLCILADHMVSH